MALDFCVENRNAKHDRFEKSARNKSLHWIFTPLRSVKTSEPNR